MLPDRKTQYIGIKNFEQLNLSALVKKSFAEINHVLNLFEVYPDDKIYVPVQYLYCDVNKSFFRLTGIDDTIVIEQLSLEMAGFETLLNSYQKYFVELSETIALNTSTNQWKAFQKTWQALFDFFIPPLDFEKKTRKTVNVLIAVYLPGGKNIAIDFSMIFDLRFMFLELDHNIGYYVLSVAGTTLVEFAEKLINIFRPVAEKTIILYGFDKHYSEQALQEASAATTELALSRESLYNKMLSNARLAGAKVIDLNCIEDLLGNFEKGKEGYLVQVLTHYNHNPDRKKSRLLFKKSSVRFDILEKKLAEMNLSGKLRDDIIIDAVTCTNFFDFRFLYSNGIRYLYMSHNDFDTDQAVFMLNELYTGINAKRINWEPVYLNGSNHLSEAMSDVYRVYFVLSRKKLLFLVP